MKKKIIHNEWKDEIVLDFKNNTLYRININDEYGYFKIENKLLFIKWNKWGSEIFIEKNNIYYLCEEIICCHSDWEDTCYLDYFNKTIYRKTNNKIGTFEIINEEIIIEWNATIPNIIHFIFGLKEQIEEFELYRYIAIKSAYDVNKPDKIYFHYYYEPFGKWWDKIKHLLTLEKITPPNKIYNNNLYHYAHQSDIIRLEKLIQYGGIYLDIDTICLKSFSDLLYHQFVMAYQNNSDNSIYGLCNAVMLSVPNSNFAIKWLESYKDFRSKGNDQYWDEHSVVRPLHLSKIYTDDIHILNNTSFFYPLWHDISNILFNEKYDINEYKQIIKNNYCIHLWDTYSHKYLKTLNENNIFTNNTIYNIFSRKFIKNKISILILTYNRYEKTKECLESYLKCLDNDYIEELIILDNNSDLELTKYLKSFQEKNEKIKLIFSSENLGVCGGRIILFKEAIGDIIISLDSDAYLISNNFFEKIIKHLYDERYGIIGVSGAYITNWDPHSQKDINDEDENEYIVTHIAGCCQAFRKDLFNYGFGLDSQYGKFWVEDTDLSLQSLYLNKINFRFPQKKYLEHHWGGSGKNFEDLFQINWNYFVNKWNNKLKLKNIL